MSYIRPLSGPVGPKQTKCEIRHEVVHLNPDDHITLMTSTKTPDVPNGGSFAVKTRTCIMWAGPATTKVIVTTQVDWSGWSPIKGSFAVQADEQDADGYKGIVNSSAISGQKAYHSDLEKAMRAYIQEHQDEFLPEGVDVAAAQEELAETAEDATDDTANASPAEQGDHGVQDRNAVQQIVGAATAAAGFVAATAKMPVDLVANSWRQSASTTSLYFLVVFLVLSNLYTLIKMGKREELGRRKEILKAEERERWVENRVKALCIAQGGVLAESSTRQRPTDVVEVVQRTLQQQEFVSSPAQPTHTMDGSVSDTLWKEQASRMMSTLATMEERMKAIEQRLAKYEQIDALD